MDNDFSDDISFENVGKIKRAKNHSTNLFFMGYPRKDGRVGTQNVWLFFPLVFCENRNIELLKTIFEREFYPDKLHEHQQFLRGLVQNEDIRTELFSINLLRRCPPTKPDEPKTKAVFIKLGFYKK